MSKENLTEKEILFCELYANGEAPFAGNAVKCYTEAFGTSSIKSKHSAKLLLSRPEIRAYLEELDGLTYEEAKYMKKFLTENLIHIIEEASTAEYRDRKGTLLSPAALRSVAVNATKALMDMHPIKEAQINRLNIEGNGEGGVVFNVIVPNHQSEKKSE